MTHPVPVLSRPMAGWACLAIALGTVVVIATSTHDASTQSSLLSSLPTTSRVSMGASTTKHENIANTKQITHGHPRNGPSSFKGVRGSTSAKAMGSQHPLVVQPTESLRTFYGVDHDPPMDAMPLSRYSPTTPWAWLGMFGMTIAALFGWKWQTRRSQNESLSILSSIGYSSTANPPVRHAMMANNFTGFFDTVLNVDSLNLLGDWKQVGSTYIKMPPGSPTGIVYFIGGAFAGAAPHILYRTFLDGIVAKGYVVVASCYRLEFDYNNIADVISASVDKANVYLDSQVPTRKFLPTFGVGHSCGALMHAFMATRPNPPQRTGYTLISFNNRNLDDAVPGLNDVVRPVAAGLYDANSATPEPIGKLVENGIEQARSFTKEIAKSTTSLPFIPPVFAKEILPLVDQVEPVADQVGPILEDIKSVDNFSPPPAQVKQAIGESFPTKSALFLQFSDDNLDDTPELLGILKYYDQGPEGGMQHKILDGTHLTPLAQDILPDVEQVPEVLRPLREAIITGSGGAVSQLRKDAMRDYDACLKSVVDYMDAEGLKMARGEGAEPVATSE